MQDTLNSKKKGDVAFRHKEFKTAIDYYTQVNDSANLLKFPPIVQKRNHLTWLFIMSKSPFLQKKNTNKCLKYPLMVFYFIKQWLRG